MSAETCVSWLLRVSNALLAEATNRLRTSADIVAISAIPSFTTSFESLLKCSLGSNLCTNIAINAQPKTSAKTIHPIAIGLKAQPPWAAGPSTDPPDQNLNVAARSGPFI